jgi:hypothetical protein
LLISRSKSVNTFPAHTFAIKPIFQRLRFKISHIIIWLVALSIFNNSISTADINSFDFSNYTDDDLDDWNEFESLYEFVAEKVLKFENAVPDSNLKHANEHSILKKHGPGYVWMRIQKTKIDHHTAILKLLPVITSVRQKPVSGFITLFSPPPDVAV